MPSTRPSLAALAAALALTGCGSDECSTGDLNRFVHEKTLDWYLYYPDDLPDPVPDPAAYGDPAELLAALTAPSRAAGKDRGWSYVASLRAVSDYYATGGSVGFGFSLQIRDGRLLLAMVMGGSAADDAGFLRGDEILAILDADGVTVLAETPFTSQTLASAIGPAVAGVTRTFEVAPYGGGATETRAVTKRDYDLDPVDFKLVERGSGIPPVGYLSFLTFISTADPQLGEAFAAFHAAGVQDVIVDVRYNGGGLLNTAEVLANLLGGGLEGRTMFSWWLNAAHAPEAPGDTLFAPVAGTSVAARRIAFVTTRGSASASELVANSLEPHVPVALVGDRTYGKPVGQLGFDLPSCDLLLGLIAFGHRNSQGDGEYFGGLPDVPVEGEPRFSGPLCLADDDLTAQLGDPAEASVGEALYFLENGACPPDPAPASPALRASVLRASRDAVFPAAADPTPAQRDVAGLF